MTPSALDVVPVQEAVLDEAGVDALFADLAAAATLLGIATRGGARTRAVEPEAPGDLPGALVAARAGLRDGRHAGVQVRYRHGDQEWWDTLLRGPDGVRLIRICHDDALSRGRPR